MNKETYISQENLEMIKKFRLMDDDFMAVCFSDNIEAIQLVVRIIMDNDTLTVIDVKTQYELKNLRRRSVRLDVFARDAAGKLYNLEIQRADKGAEVKRARYNSSLIDAGITEPGEDFEQLPETYVIFITENDVRGGNRALYEYIYKDVETHEPLDDGTHIIYVNNKIQDNTRLGRLMHDFAEQNPERMYYPELEKTTRYFKENEEGVSAMCKMMEDRCNKAMEQGIKQGIEKGIKQGIEKGIEKGQLQNMYSLLKKGLISLQVAMSEMNMSDKDLKEAFEKHGYVL